MWKRALKNKSNDMPYLDSNGYKCLEMSDFLGFFVVSYLRIERWIVWGTQDAALFTSWLAQCATIKYTTRTGEQSCESNITKQQKNSWRCFVSRHNNDAKRTNGKWRRNSPINILLASGGAKRRAERIVMHESCGLAGTHEDSHSPTLIFTT